MQFKTKVLALIVVLAFIFSFMAMGVFANEVGIVCVDALNVREQMSYESQILGVLYKDDRISVISAYDGWLQINFNDQIGYVSGKYVCLPGIYEGSADSGFVTASVLNVRLGSSYDSPKTGELIYGDIVKVIGSEGEFYMVDLGGKTAYVAKQYIELGSYTQLASRSASLRTERSSSGAKVVELAKQYLGVPYVYGGTSPNGFDCSGFTSYVYSKLGYNIARTAAGQANYGVKISKDELLPGDLVFFNTYGGISHVGIYAGSGQMIHSPYSGKTVSYASINSGYYASRFVTARRIVE